MLNSRVGRRRQEPAQWNERVQHGLQDHGVALQRVNLEISMEFCLIEHFTCSARKSVVILSPLYDLE